MSESKIDTHPLRDVVLKQVLLGKMTIREAASRLQVSEKTLWHYIKKGEVSTSEEPSDLIELLRDILKKLKLRVEELLARPVSYQDEKMLSMNVSNLEKIVMDLAKLTKQIQSAPLVQIQHIEVQYNKLQQFMLERLCVACKSKLLKYLEGQEVGV